MVFHLNDTVFLGAWAIVGSTLGYLAFRSSPKNSPSERLKQCLLSVGLGLFLAFPLYEYLNDSDVFSFPKNLNMMLSGVGAFGLPDIILRHWPKIVNKIMDRLFGTNPYEQYGNHNRNNTNNSNHEPNDFGE